MSRFGQAVVAHPCWMLRHPCPKLLLGCDSEVAPDSSGWEASASWVPEGWASTYMQYDQCLSQEQLQKDDLERWAMV